MGRGFIWQDAIETDIAGVVTLVVMIVLMKKKAKAEPCRGARDGVPFSVLFCQGSVHK